MSASTVQIFINKILNAGQAGDLVDSAIFELGTVREVLISLMAELQNRTTPRSTPTSVSAYNDIS